MRIFYFFNILFLCYCTVKSPIIREREKKLLHSERHNIFNSEEKVLLKNEKSSKIVIIIDDFGLHPHQIEQFLLLDIPITFSILPLTKYGGEYAEILHRLKKEVILHLPLEPEEKKEMTIKGFLTTEMTAEEIINNLHLAIKSIPHIRGISTHMGSKYTKSKYHMRLLLMELKKKGLFFIDSRTHPQSIAYEVATEVKIPYLQRDVFIDNEREVGKILKQLKIVEKIASEKGLCVAVGHPYKETAKALSIWLKEIKPFSFSFLYASQILNYP